MSVKVARLLPLSGFSGCVGSPDSENGMKAMTWKGVI